MHPVRKQRLYMVLFITAFSTLAVGLMVYALRENINLFYSPAKIVAGEVPLNTRIRAGGCVLPGSVERDRKTLQVGFQLTDGMANLQVYYSGILPDLFAEGEAAVVNGMVREDGAFYATEVLAKHDEQYMPPEVAEAMMESGELAQTCEGMQYGR
jgi:cytochrome c-type biogenesis protein CcmE